MLFICGRGASLKITSITVVETEIPKNPWLIQILPTFEERNIFVITANDHPLSKLLNHNIDLKTLILCLFIQYSINCESLSIVFLEISMFVLSITNIL